MKIGPRFCNKRTLFLGLGRELRRKKTPKKVKQTGGKRKKKKTYPNRKENKGGKGSIKDKLKCNRSKKLMKTLKKVDEKRTRRKKKETLGKNGKRRRKKKGKARLAISMTK